MCVCVCVFVCLCVGGGGGGGGGGAGGWTGLCWESPEFAKRVLKVKLLINMK